MTNGSSSKTQPTPSTPQATNVAAAGLVLSTLAGAISAEAEERDRSLLDPPGDPAASNERLGAGSAIARRRRKPRLQRRVIVSSESASVSGQPPSLDVTGDAAGEPSRPDTRSELRDWIKDNATLLSNASLLISLAAVALSLLPDVGFFAPYIKALIFAAALLLLIELHHQWPEDLQLHMLRKNARPENHSWRMIGFAFVMQVATLIFAAWAILTNPIILLPLTALAVVLAFRQWYFRRFGGLLARSFGIVALVAVLLLTEVLVVVVWAALAGEQVTLELWVEDRPGLQIDR
jgi:hypothetical protein